MRKKLPLLFFVTQFVVSALSAQNKTIDSLLSLLKNVTPDTTQVNRLNKLCTEYTEIGHYDTAFYYGNTALHLAQQINIKKGIANCSNNIGIIYDEQGDYSKAIEYYSAALKIQEEIGNKHGMAYGYNNIGVLYEEQGNNSKALENYFAALKMVKEAGDKRAIGNIYDNIGIIYFNQGKFDKSLESYLACVKTGKETGDKNSVAWAYNNIGELYSFQGKTDKALENYFSSLQIKEEVSDKRGIAKGYINIGLLYGQKNNYPEAIGYLQKGVQLSQEIRVKQLQMDAYKGLSEVSEKMKDYHNAYKYHLLYSQFKDSIFNEKNSKEIAVMQTKYETEKKEKEIKIQSGKLVEQELLLSRNRLLLILLAVGSSLLIVLGWFAFSRYKIKNESQLKSEKLSNQEQLTKAIIETQEKERKRIAQDLHDGIGHKLTTLKFNLEKITDTPRIISPEERIIFDQTENILDETHSELRALSHAMMPKALQERELADAVSDLVEQTLANSTLKYSLKNVAPAGLPENIQVCLYRVLQELLNNILKHAHATEIAIQIFKNKNTLIMMVEDNGMGIRNNKTNGIGLHNISGRVTALNGIFTIEPGHVKGTVGTVRIPLQES